MSIISPPQNGNHATPAKQQPAKTIDQWLKDPGVIDQFKKSLPAHIKPDRFARVCLTAMNRTPKLRQCTIDSLMRCLMDCSALGLEPDGRRAHLIPFEDRKNNVTICTLIIDYKGYVELVRRSSMVSKIHADVVCDGDEFEHNLGEIIRHSYDLKADRDEATWYAVYAMVQFKDGATQAIVMSRKQVEKIRDKSQGWIAAQKYNKPHPWGEQAAEMAKKTAFRRLTKWLTLSPEIVDAIQTEDDSEDRVIETTARPAIEAASGNDRLAAMLSPAADASQDYDDGGPTSEDLSGTVDHTETTKRVDPIPMIISAINKAKSAEVIEAMVADEQNAGVHSQEDFAKIVAAMDARKAVLASKGGGK